MTIELDESEIRAKLSRMIAEPGGVSVVLFKSRDGQWRASAAAGAETRMTAPAYPVLVFLTGHVFKDEAL